MIHFVASVEQDLALPSTLLHHDILLAKTHPIDFDQEIFDIIVGTMPKLVRYCTSCHVNLTISILWSLTFQINKI